MSGKPICVTFDETTIVYCNMCVVVGFVNNDGVPQQEVISLEQFIDAPNEKKSNLLSDIVINALEVKLKHPKELVKVFIRDGAIINELAIKKLIGGTFAHPETGHATVWPAQYNARNIKCFAHTIDRCGADYKVQGVRKNRIEGISLRDFYDHLNGYFSHPGSSVNNKWWGAMHSAVPSVSPTRWWSKEEFF